MAARHDPRRTPALPAWALALAVAGLLVAGLPVLALVVRADWGHLGADLTSAGAASALWLSLTTAACATLACVVLGVPLALVLAGGRGFGTSLLRAIVLIPLVLPPLVGGLALLALLGRHGLLGGPLASATGLALPFTTAAVVIAQTFVALPFLVVSVEGALRGRDPGDARAAASLGASPSRVFWTVTLPALAPALRAGIVLSFARALGEFGATALFAGNLPGVTQTMPLAIYAAFNGAGVSRGAATALALLLVVCAVVLLAASGQLMRSGGRRP
ncbi:MAG: ABC transporter permease [Actinomycetia bacterium]|nr:ABC transporter permease [Actinomycetes bacterium]